MLVISEQVDMYQNVIDAWEATGIPLFVVDSSGNNYFNKTSNYSCFDESKHGYIGPSKSEKISIQHAIDMFRFEQYDIVVKVTGKYFIKDLVHQFQYVPTGTDMIVSTNQDFECFGASVTIMATLLKRIDVYHSFEEVIHDSISQKEFQVIRLPSK